MSWCRRCSSLDSRCGYRSSRSGAAAAAAAAGVDVAGTGGGGGPPVGT